MTEQPIIQVNAPVNAEDAAMLDTICKEDERNRAQTMRWLIRQEYARRYSQPTLLTVAEAVATAQEAATRHEAATEGAA